MASTVDTKDEAFEVVEWLFGGIKKNEVRSERVGYDIYDLEDDPTGWVSDLETRLEVNYSKGEDIKTKSIHIRQTDECTIGGLFDTVEYGTRARICITVFDMPFEFAFEVQKGCISPEMSKKAVHSTRINEKGELEVQI